MNQTQTIIINRVECLLPDNRPHVYFSAMVHGAKVLGRTPEEIIEHGFRIGLKRRDFILPHK